MEFNGVYIAEKLKRWENYLLEYRLPEWEEIPDIGLYMDQLIPLMRGYLNYLPSELREEDLITPSAINNYVRKGIMPEPVKKRYYRKHIAYLIIICTLKQSLPLSALERILPAGLDELSLKAAYCAFTERHSAAAETFLKQMRTCAPLDAGADFRPATKEETDGIILTAALVSGFSKLLAEKLILLG